MKNLLITISVTLLTIIVVLNFVQLDHLKYVSLDYWFDNEFGAFTDASGTTELSDFPTLYNANLDKTIEIGTTTLPTITTLSNLTTAGSLVTVGALSSGSLASGFTPVTMPLGGTGSTTLSAYRLLLGNGASAIDVATSTGVAGQYLVSGGEGAKPNWQTSTIDSTLDYTWSGKNIFNDNNVGIATGTPSSTLSVQGSGLFSGNLTVANLTATGSLTVLGSAFTINDVAYEFPSSDLATSSLQSDGSGTLTWTPINSYSFGSTSPKRVSYSATITHNLGRLPRKVKATMFGQINNNANNSQMPSYSVGTATSTRAVDQSYTGYSDANGRTRNSYTGTGNIANLTNAEGSSKANIKITAWTTTTLTFSISSGAGNTQGNRGFYLEVE